MSRRTLWIDAPGTDGVITDLTASQLPARALTRGADAIMPNGLVRQRRGWSYDGLTPDTVTDLNGVARVAFSLSAAFRTVTGDVNGTLFIHTPGAGTLIYQDLGHPRLPRAVYNDELLWCAQDGITPLLRYGGAGNARTVSSGTPAYTGAGKSTITGMTLSGTPDRGSFMFIHGDALDLYYRVLEGSTTSVTLDGITVTSGGSCGNTGTLLYGFAAPAVSVYETGTITVVAPDITGYGTSWVTDLDIKVNRDAILIIPDTGNAEIRSVSSVTSNVLAGAILSDQATPSPYKVCRPLPFRDVAAHKLSLYGIGVKQHKSRVYVGPPGWNISFPPGVASPFNVNPATVLSAEDYHDFLMDFIDVPAPNDADECMAVLSSDGPAVVPKRKDAYGVYGAFGGLDAVLLPEGAGAGCIDVRSAWNLSIGPVWAGSQGVYALIGGRVHDLTEKRIQTEWRGLTKDFDYGVLDYCTIGEKGGVLVVHLTTAGGTIKRTWHLYPYDDAGKLNPRWLDRVSNFAPRYQWSSKVVGEDEKLLAVTLANQGRVINYGPALDGTGNAGDGDGTYPALDITTGSGLAREAGAKVDERLLEVAVEANIYDTAGSGSIMSGSVLSSQSLDSDTTTTTALNGMASKNADLPKPYIHQIGVKAGLHQVRISKAVTQTTEKLTEISRIGITVRASKRPL